VSGDQFITLMERYCQLGSLLPDPDTFGVDDLAALAEHRLTPGGGFLLHLLKRMSYAGCVTLFKTRQSHAARPLLVHA
jgi:hypothetical protein